MFIYQICSTNKMYVYMYLENVEYYCYNMYLV